jgi:CRISPR/Cas system-associated endoribonuclease Cas2
MQLHGLEILIERMQSYPHEFTHEGKWTEILVAIDKHLTDEERQTLKQGFADMARGVFNEVVLKGIANEPVEYDMIEIIKQDYDSIMAYPLERQKALEREKWEAHQRQIEMDKMRINQQSALQGLGGQSAYGNAWQRGL